MKARWVLWLYPRAWRQRYRAELEALMEDAGSGGRDTFDVLKEAVRMRVMEPWSFAQLAVVLGLVGVAAAVVTWTARAPEFVSQAEMRVSTPAGSGATVDDQVVARLLQIQNEILSRTSLSAVIQDPLLGLYVTERRSQPLEDVIEKMRRKDLEIRMVRMPGAGIGVKVGFRYPDRRKAQQKVMAMIAKFEDANEVEQRTARAAPLVDMHEPVDVLDPPSLPMRSEHGVLRPFYASSGKPEEMTGEMAIVFGLGGLLAAVIAKGFSRKLRLVSAAIVLGIAGAAVGAVIPWMGWKFVSHADVMMTMPQMGVEDRAALERIAKERFGKVRGEVLSAASLGEVIQNPGLDLYRGERVGKPLESVIQGMRRDVQITLSGAGSYGAMVSISFRYADRFKAQRVVQALVTKTIDAANRLRSPEGAGWTLLPLTMHVTDAPSKGMPFRTSVWRIVAVGLAAGVGMAGVTRLMIRARAAETA